MSACTTQGGHKKKIETTAVKYNGLPTGAAITTTVVEQKLRSFEDNRLR